MPFLRRCAIVVATAIAALGGCMESGNLDPVGRRAASSLCVDGASDACTRWSCSDGDVVAAAWIGDPGSCAAGAIDADARRRALDRINVYRALAGVQLLTVEPSWEAPAQDCALLAHANRKLSHEPSPDWACWSDRGARASAVSLVANRSAPIAIDAFLEDVGNEPTMVHRRWLLSEKVRRIGLGSTTSFACALVDGREWDDPDHPPPPVALSTNTWVAWPPPGSVPIDALQKTRVDAMGWTVQSSSLDLDGARVEVRIGDRLAPVKVFALERMLGSLTAIRFVPDGWSTTPGTRYAVHVEKEGVLVDYEVEPVTCAP